MQTTMRSSPAASTYLTIVMLLCGCQLVRGMQIIVEHPQNTSTLLGETVILKCRVENQKGTLQWVKNGFGLGTTRDLPLFDRYNMVGKLNLGEYHLQIRNVSVDDEDVYECQLSPTDNEPIQISRAAHLTVLAEPSPPVFVGLEPNGGASSRVKTTPPSPTGKTGALITTIEAVEGGAVTLSCRSEGGRPAARVDWAITADAAAREIVNYISAEATDAEANSEEGASQRRHHHIRHQQRNRIHATNDGAARNYVGRIVENASEDENGFTTITSNLTFAPTSAENAKYLACIVVHETFAASGEDAPKSVAVALDVSYRPKITVKVDERDSSIMEGGRAVVRCLVDARPSRDLIVKWSWSGEEKRLAILDQHSAMISGLRLKDNAARITCSATNSIGSESSSLKLNIPYGPRFMSTNQTQLIRRGETATFHCDALGNPTPEVRWYRGATHTDDFLATGINYTISDVQEADVGQYRCVATVIGFEPKALTHQLYLKGPPIVYLNPNLIEEPSGAVTLSCEIQTRVFPLKLVWKYNQRALIDAEVTLAATESGLDSQKLLATTDDSKKTNDKRVRLVNAARAYGVESRLTMTRFDVSAHGAYMCGAQNEYGLARDERDVFRRSAWQKMLEFAESMPPTYRIAAPVGALSLLVCVLLICCMCCHARRKGGEKSTRRCCCFCCGAGSKSSNYSHDNSGDVIVKCEALDGGQFYPELYGSPQMERSDLLYAKDYVAVPQSNPDLDYLPPSTMNYGIIPYGNTVAPAVQQQSINNETSYQPYGSHSQTFIGASYANSNGSSGNNGRLLNGELCNGNVGYASNNYNGGLSNLYGSHADYGTGYYASHHHPQQQHQQLQSQAHQHHHLYAPSNNLETLMEVTTPETIDGESVHAAMDRRLHSASSQLGLAGASNNNTASSTHIVGSETDEQQNRQQLQQQDRPVSRVSTHV